MPVKRTLERAQKAKREGKAPTTQAGEFVREEIEHIRHGKHGARSPEQAIAIGLSKARRAGVKVPPPKEGTTSEETRERAKRDLKAGRRRTTKTASSKRSAARRAVLKTESGSAASSKALSEHAKRVAASKGRGRGKSKPAAPRSGK